MNTKPSLLLAGFFWLNFVGLTWMLVFDFVQADPMSGFAAVAFFVLAVVTSAMATK